MNRTRNVIAIDRVEAGTAIGLTKVSSTSVKVSDSTPWESIAIKIPARLTYSDKIEDGVRIYTTKLVFRTCDDMDERSRYIYKCKCADGQSFLIGTNGRPYPITTVSLSLADNMTDSQLAEVTVTYNSTEKLPHAMDYRIF